LQLIQFTFEKRQNLSVGAYAKTTDPYKTIFIFFQLLCVFFFLHV